MSSFAPISTITVDGCDESIGQSFEASKDCEVTPGRRKDESLNLRIRNHRPSLLQQTNLLPALSHQSIKYLLGGITLVDLS